MASGTSATSGGSTSLAPAVVGPVTEARLHECRQSAKFWSERLPLYADRNQQWANFFSITAGVLSAITGLAVWSVLTKEPSTNAQIAVSGVALLSAICALVPRVMNYAENAGLSRELATQYGRLYGELIDLTHISPIDQARATRVISDFQVTKEKKDGLPGTPTRSVVEGNRPTKKIP